KQAAGALDFADLLVRARDLIRDDADVRRHLRQKFTRIFVDEFQDTDPIQAEILELLADNVPGKLFIVGYPKQAIYRFGGTDVGTYWDVRDRLEAGGGRVLHLTTSYGSVPGRSIRGTKGRDIPTRPVGGKACQGSEEVGAVAGRSAAFKGPTTSWRCSLR